MSPFSFLFFFTNLLLISTQVLASMSSKPMDYEDIVTLEKPREVAVSIDGRVAFVVQTVNIDKNCNKDIVYLCCPENNTQQKLWELDKVEKLFWGKGILYALVKKDESYQILSLTKDATSILLSTSLRIDAFVIDSLRSRIYYTQTKYTPQTIVQNSKEEGYVYRWGSDYSLMIFGDRQYAHREWEEIWCLDIGTEKPYLVTALSYKDWCFDDSLITDLRISEDGNFLAILANRTGHPELGESIGCHEIWLWNRNQRTLDKIQSNAKSLEDFLVNNKNLVFQKVDQNTHISGYVLEDVNTPPQVVICDRDKGISFQLTSLNSKLNQISRGHVEPMTITKNDQLSVKGYLIHPVNKEKEKRYPLIIATYGFRGKTFIADAEWHSSFPAQVLANEGYYVLLLNHCGLAQKLVGDSQRARQIEGWNVLEIFEHAVDMLDKQGLINPDQVGIYGWSHGAFMVEFIISHSNKFHVACIGEGADYGPSVFFLSGAPYMTKICDNIYGGPPWGDNLKNYIDFSTLFNIEHIRTPLLMEYAGGFGAVGGMEIYVPLRYLNIPAELIVYEGEEHNFVKPKARMASMARKVEWFNYWLLNRSNPEKTEQNARWEKMKMERS
ncbi:hypothetical protein PHSC3_000912 [Chlamydiales bacterium STE3]|nr:hypothetical protein PHSC3_000912 [Chlamydiales bacterium STE3]